VFNYTAHDSNGNEVTGSITVNVLDDVPTAAADTNSVDEGAVLSVPAAGVLTNDVLGADGAASGGAVTGVAIGTDTSAPVSGNVAGDLVGSYGTLHLNADGSYTYTANDNAVSADSPDHFFYTITDGDGDTSTTTLDITVNNVDRIPTGGTVNAFVDDEGLANGILGGTDDIDANSGESGTGTSSEAVWTGTLAGSGGDAPISFLFSADLEGDPVTVGTESATYHVSDGGMTLTAVGDRGTIFTVHIDDPTTGDYTLTLNDNVLHTEGDNTEASATVDIPYTVQDADTSTAPGTIHATFNDDMPSAVSAADIESIENGNGAIATAGLDDGAGGDGFLVDNFGADGGKVIFTSDTITSLEGQALTHDTSALSYVISEDGQTLTGYVNTNADAGYQDGTDTKVFTIELQEGGSTDYKVTMFESLDSLSQVDFDDGSYEHNGGNPDFFAFFDPDVDNSSDLLITPIEGGNTTGTINLNSNLFGVSQGNSVGSDEAVRIDFVTDVEATGGNIGDWTFDGHYLVNGASASFGSTPGSVARISAFSDTDANTTVGDGDQVNVTGVAISYNGVGGGTSAVITEADDLDHDGVVEVTIGTNEFTVTFNDDGTVDVGGLKGSSNGTVTTTVAVFTDAPYSSLEFAYVSGTEFLIGNFGAAVKTTDPVDFTVPISVVDGDGDTVDSGELAIHAVTPDAGSSLTTQSVSTLMTDSGSSNTLTSNLVSSNDNSLQHTQETQRVLSSGQNAAVMGALAAVGLESDHMRIDWSAAAHGSNHAHELMPLHTASLAPASVEASSSVASAQVAQPLTESHAMSTAPQGGSHFHDMVQQVQSASHGDGGHVQAMTALLHGSDAPAHGPAAHANTVMAPAVAMPSAAQLAAAGAHADGGKQASGDGVQHNAVVGKVLADSLNGGEGHGPNIDALLAAHGGHAGAPDVIEALASHGAGGVPYGHSGGSSAIAMAHSMFSMAMHHDAAPPAHG
jgi:VCBS repeat-containing protein